MGRIDRRGRTGIWEYKHKESRRYLRIDDALVIYRYVPPADLDSCDGRYVRDAAAGGRAPPAGTGGSRARPRDPDDYCRVLQRAVRPPRRPLDLDEAAPCV